MLLDARSCYLEVISDSVFWLKFFVKKFFLDILVVRSGGGDNVDEQDLDYGSSYFADLRPRNPVWRRL